MPHLNIEFKAKVNNFKDCESRLAALNPVFIGEDHQVDTYYNSKKGRLKLREGNIENALIHYIREDIAGSKESQVILHPVSESKTLKEILENSNEVLVVVDKVRRIYFIENVKFHFDEVKGLGSFIEVEAIDITGEKGKEKLQEQCNYYSDFFGIGSADYMKESYSDMLMGIDH